MSRVFELFGFPIDTWDELAWENLRRGFCPFMGSECDGGGNRFSSGISLVANPRLKTYFAQGLSKIQAGICSLQLHEDEQPWIVCPRRLLNFRTNDDHLQEILKKSLFSYAELRAGHKYNVWSEVKLKCTVEDGGKESLFDYTFDYVIAGCCRKSISYLSQLIGKSESQVKHNLEGQGRTLVYADGEYWFDDFPDAKPIIIEVMTSSTSGGNERNRTQVGQVFEDTIYKLAGKEIEPIGPGINYRQVWARMISQLLVKSQIGLAWGGITFWLIQDLLADYITKTTALNLRHFLSHHISEVNILSSGYGNSISPVQRSRQLIDIPDVKLYSGPMANERNEEDFSDIVKLGCTPPIEALWKRLLEKKPCASFIATA